MTEAGWKLVVDRQGVTIANDRFQLTTNGSRQQSTELALDGTGHIEAVVSELQTMTWQTYGQFCGLAHALEIVGERWAMLIVRDLLVGAKTAEDLRRGLPRIPIDILAIRLKELENSGVVRRRAPERSGHDAGEVYELTEHGHQLDTVAVTLARWGAQTLGEPRAEDVVTTDSLIMAMRSTFQPQVAAGLRIDYELRFGKIVVHARIADGGLRTAEGSLPDADLVIETGPIIRALMAGDVSPAEAIDNGSVRITGDPELLTRFVEIFHIPRPPTRPI